MHSRAGVRWRVQPGFCVFANVAATTPGTGDDSDTTSGGYRGGSERDSCAPTSPEWTAPVRARYRFLGLRHITRRRTDRESTLLEKLLYLMRLLSENFPDQVTVERTILGAVKTFQE